MLVTNKVHFHVVPAPFAVESSGLLSKWSSSSAPLPLLGRRGELSDEEGAEISAVLSGAMARARL